MFFLCFKLISIILSIHYHTQKQWKNNIINCNIYMTGSLTYICLFSSSNLLSILYKNILILHGIQSQVHLYCNIIIKKFSRKQTAPFTFYFLFALPLNKEHINRPVNRVMLLIPKIQWHLNFIIKQPKITCRWWLYY